MRWEDASSWRSRPGTRSTHSLWGSRTRATPIDAALVRRYDAAATQPGSRSYANPAEGLGDSGNDGSSLPPARRDILRSGSFVPCAADRGRKTQPERNLAGAQRRELESAGAH